MTKNKVKKSLKKASLKDKDLAKLKKQIEKATKKVVKDYGDVILKLGEE